MFGRGKEEKILGEVSACGCQLPKSDSCGVLETGLIPMMTLLSGMALRSLRDASELQWFIFATVGLSKCPAGNLT